MDPIKHCPFCGHEAAQLYCQEGAGDGGVPRYRVACYQCGALSDFFDCFVHGRNEDETKDKAIKAWNRRARTARNEDLADAVGEMRQLFTVIQQGCKAKTQAADKARDAIRRFLGSKSTDGLLDMILPLAKRYEIKEHDVCRAAR